MTQKAGTSCDREHEFALVLTGISDLTDEVQDAIYGAGCDDATLSMRSGVVYLTFARQAPSVKDAILSAIQEVQRAKIGARVVRVDECNLVTQAEIGRRISRSRQLVHQYIKGTRGPGGFPPPIFGLMENCPIWAWCEVAYWLRLNNMIPDEVLIDARQIYAINCFLEYYAMADFEPALVDEMVALQGG